VDESGIDKYIYRPQGRAFFGEIIQGMISGRRYQRESFVAGKVGSKIIAPFCYQGTCNTELFNYWIENILIPELVPGQVVIMDNATFHKSQKTKDLIESVGCEILFLPPYSPDLNPIEIFWANFKRMVKENIRIFQSLSEAIDESFLSCMAAS
jgi:transposase